MKFKLLKSFNITTKTDRRDLQKILNDIQVIKLDGIPIILMLYASRGMLFTMYLLG